MTGPDDHTPAGGGRRHGQGYDAARQHRLLLDEIDHLRSEVRNRLSDHRSEVREHLRHELGGTNDHLAQALADLHDLQARVAELSAHVNHSPTTPPNDTNHATGPTARVHGPAEPEEAEEDAPPRTPAVGWDQMDRATAEQAWAALGEFVEDVLYRQYQLTRLQVPDCWPLHPRMIRELAWLRATYLDAGAVEPDEPTAAMPWHIRCIPGFLINVAEAIDPRECRPGIHRLTEAEVSRFTVAGQTARREGGPEPLLTTENGHDRPHLIPAHFPTRVTKASVTQRSSDDVARAPTVDGLPDLIVGACHPQYWRDHHRAAAAADLATRT